MQILDDHPDDPPAWVLDVLTEAQAAPATGDVFKYRKLIYLSDVSKSAKAVALCIADKCRDNQPYCWPAIDTLAAETAWNRRSVIRAVEELERREFVLVERAKDDTTKRQLSNFYFLAWPSRVTPVHPEPSRVTHSHEPGDTQSRAG